VDLVLDEASAVLLAECKSGQTLPGDAFAALRRLTSLLESRGETRPVARRVVYGGQTAQSRSEGAVVPWRQICDVPWGPASVLSFFAVIVLRHGF